MTSYCRHPNIDNVIASITTWFYTVPYRAYSHILIIYFDWKSGKRFFSVLNAFDIDMRTYSLINIIFCLSDDLYAHKSYET